MQSDKVNTLLVDSVHLKFGQRTILQSAFLTAHTGRMTGVLGRKHPRRTFFEHSAEYGQEDADPDSGAEGP